MFSFDNVFIVDEFVVWVGCIYVEVGDVVYYLCEFKIDGVVLFLVYCEGWLIWVFICGDGCIGEDVILNVWIIVDVFEWFIFGDDYLVFEVFEVCGEVFFWLDDF